VRPLAQERDEAVPFEVAVPFARGFPPAGGEELTRSYRAALERAIEEEKRLRAEGS